MIHNLLAYIKVGRKRRIPPLKEGTQILDKAEYANMGTIRVQHIGKKGAKDQIEVQSSKEMFGIKNR